MAILLVYLRQYYLQTSREIKRLDSILRSPIYNHISSTVMGRSSIKAFNLGESWIDELWVMSHDLWYMSHLCWQKKFQFNLEEKLINRFNELQDNQGGSYLLFCATSRPRIQPFKNSGLLFEWKVRRTLIKVAFLPIGCHNRNLYHNLIICIYSTLKESKVFRTVWFFGRLCWANA